MDTARFDYVLPPDRIAQSPCEPRDAARLLVAWDNHTSVHRQVHDLPDLMVPGDLLVLNRTRVIPARLVGRKGTGGTVEVLLVHPEVCDDKAPCWQVLIRGRVQPGTRILIAGLRCEVLITEEDGGRVLRFPKGTDVLALANRCGRIPLPPYITREADATDRDRYQTVFADSPGSVAAPTASLHLTEDLLHQLESRGVTVARVDLAIGPGTFRPVTADQVETHRLHPEFCRCPAETVRAVTTCRERGGRVIAVGTTVVRSLETAWRQPGGFGPWTGWTDLFLHPPARVESVDALLTNFHLPRSSLLMLVACLTGIDRLHALYHEAIDAGYRFYSYGDAMLIGAADASGGQA